MERRYGSQSMFAPLRRVLVRRPGQEFAEADPARWHYAGPPDLPRAQAEHDALVELLRASGAEVCFHESVPCDQADALYVHDPILMTDAGAILLRMGKELRVGEPAAIASTLEGLGIPVYAELAGGARAEGGDLLWLDEGTLAAGIGFRTNASGVAQLGLALAPLGVEIVPVPLPFGPGPEACLHLMSLISVLDADLAVAHLPLLPVPFVQLLRSRGFELVEVPGAELPGMGTNVLAVAPRDCVVLDGSPLTRIRLEEHGCRVRSYVGREISLKAEGGPTCLTRPLWRDG